MAKTSGSIRGGSNPVAMQNRVANGNPTSDFKKVSSKDGTTIYKDENGNKMEITKNGSSTYATLSNKLHNKIINTLSNDKNIAIIKATNAPVKNVTDTKAAFSEFSKKYNLSGLNADKFSSLDTKFQMQIMRDAQKVKTSISK